MAIYQDVEGSLAAQRAGLVDLQNNPAKQHYIEQWSAGSQTKYC
jgi:hypothetical protein